ERQVGAPMRTLPVDEPERAAAVAIENQVLAEQPHRLDGDLVEFGGAADRHPVAPQVVAHRRAGTDLREQPVVFSAQHSSLPAHSNPVGTFLLSLSSFMPEASAMVSIRAAKSFCRY